MEIRNPWTSYLTRSYEQIKLSVVQRLIRKVPELRDYSQSNLMMIIVDIFAGVAEMLNYYIDSIFRELFPTTALRLSSLIKIAKQQGYNGKAALPASTDLTIQLIDQFEELVPAVTDILIPQGSTFSDKAANLWVSVQPAIIPKGLSTTRVLIKQYVPVGPLDLGTSDGTPFQSFKLGTDYADSSISLTVDGTPWALVDNIGMYPGHALVFMVYLEEDGFMYVLFGDNNTGAIPPASASLTMTINSTAGKAGNVAPNSIAHIGSPITTPPDTSLICFNPLPVKDGRGIDDVFSLSNTIPKAVYTLQRAITRKDYEYIAEMAPGIREAKVVHICGGALTIHVAPYTTGIATQTQLVTTKEYVEARSNLSIGDILVKSAGESVVNLGLSIKTFPNAIQEAVQDAVTFSLLYKYNVDVQEINGNVRLSDIYALVDSVNNVDYVNIDQLYIEPYIRSVGTDITLSYKFRVESEYAKSVKYKLTYDNVANIFHLYLGNTLVTDITPDVETQIDNHIFLTINEDLTIPNGSLWGFETQPANTNIQLQDGTLPVLRLDNLTINFI